MRVFLQAIYGQVFLGAYIMRRGYQALPPRKAGRVIFFAFFVVEWLLYFMGFFFYKDLSDPVLHFIMLICNTWYIASFYLTLGLIALDLVRLSNRIRAWYPNIIKRHWNCTKMLLFVVFVLSVTGLMIRGYHNAIHPAVRQIHIHIDKEMGGRDSLTIVMMSDWHIGEFVRKQHVQRFVELANAEHPDLIVIAGDILDYEVRQAEKQHIEEDLQQLKAPLGVYMVLGNHEYRANRFAKISWLEKTGATLLIDSVVMPDSTFYLIGRDDLVNSGRASMETLLTGVDKSKPVIVVEHQPVHVNDLIDHQCDLGLYGHTHNGQYWPFSLLLKWVFEFPYGYFSKGSSHIYVSSGIGFAGQPYRVGTRSEMVYISMNNEQ